MRSIITRGCLAVLLGGIVGAPAMAQAPPSIDWPTAGYDRARSGANPLETVIHAGTVEVLKPAWAVSIDGGAITAQAIVAAHIPTATGNHDLVIVGTENGTIAALDAATGNIVWSHNTGFSQSTCLDMPNGHFGITSAAAFDRPSNTVYAMGGDGNAYAYVAGTGAVLPGWPVNILPSKDREHVYGGLNVNAGRLYATVASMCDGNIYFGRVVEVATATAKVVNRLYTDGTVADANGNITKYGAGGGGIWGPGGVSIDPYGGMVYIATGNVKGPGADNAAYGNQVLKLTADLAVLADAKPPLGCVICDFDFGSTPVLFQPPGCAPRLAVLNKNSEVYIYRRTVFTTTALSALPNNNYVGDVAWDAASGELVSANRDGMKAYKAGAGCVMGASWSVPGFSDAGGAVGDAVSPPSIAGGLVYYGNGMGNTLFAKVVATGVNLWQYAASGPVFAPPTIVNGMVLLPTWDGMVTALRPPAVN